MGEDSEEKDAQEEETKEVLAWEEKMKIKAKTQPVAKIRAKKTAKSRLAKPTTPTTRVCIRSTTQNNKELAKEKKRATGQKGPVQKKIYCSTKHR